MKKLMLILIAGFVWSQTHSQHTLKITANNVKVNGSTSIVLKNTQLVNNGTFDAATGTVSITGNGTDAQSSIGGTSSTVFYNLEINKSGNGAQLTQNIQVDNDLEMTSGNIDLNGFDIILGTASGKIINESSSSYLTGAFGGEVLKTIDLNNPLDENPGNIGVIITSSANMGTTTIKRGHVAQDVNGEFGIYRYYDISPANNSGLNATVQFSYLDHELNGIAENELAPFRFNGTNWEEFLTTANDQVANYVETTGIDAFSTWTLAKAVAALPVELVFFQATKTDNRRVHLTWQTASEKDNDYFTVERSADGINFEFLEEISGAGNSSQPIFYQTYDGRPLNGLNYYRLKQTDFDGSFEYSEIKTVLIENENPIISIYPNPASEVLNIEIPNLQESAQFQLMDELGRLALEGTMIENQSLSIGHLPKGAYFLKIIADGQQHSQQLMLQ